jgi:hypothetical protein
MNRQTSKLLEARRMGMCQPGLPSTATRCLLAKTAATTTKRKSTATTWRPGGICYERTARPAAITIPLRGYAPQQQPSYQQQQPSFQQQQPNYQQQGSPPPGGSQGCATYPQQGQPLTQYHSAGYAPQQQPGYPGPTGAYQQLGLPLLLLPAGHPGVGGFMNKLSSKIPGGQMALGVRAGLLAGGIMEHEWET